MTYVIIEIYYVLYIIHFTQKIQRLKDIKQTIFFVDLRSKWHFLALKFPKIKMIIHHFTDLKISQNLSF